MNVNILVFGQLTEITGNSRFVLNDVTDTDDLVKQLITRYPEFSGAKYVIAVDKEVISGNTLLQQNATVAFLPPFSGG